MASDTWLSIAMMCTVSRSQACCCSCWLLCMHLGFQPQFRFSNLCRLLV
jgi:hypothetical protein